MSTRSFGLSVIQSAQNMRNGNVSGVRSRCFSLGRGVRWSKYTGR